MNFIKTCCISFYTSQFFNAGSNCKTSTMLIAELTSASDIAMLSLSYLRNNSNDAWSSVPNNGFGILFRWLSLTTFVVSPLFTDSFLVEEGYLALGLLRESEETSALTDWELLITLLVIGRFSIESFRKSIWVNKRLFQHLFKNPCKIKIKICNNI